MVFFASFALSSRTLRLKAFDRKDRQGFRKVRKEKPTRGCRWKHRRLPGFARSHWKGNSRRDVPACLCPFPDRWPMVVSRLVKIGTITLANDQRPKTNDERPKPCFLPTNSAAPSPICGSRSPTAATTSVFTAAPGTRARSTATCPLPTICAWRGCWSNLEFRRSASPGESRCCAGEWWTSSANWPSCAPAMEKISTSR